VAGIQVVGPDARHAHRTHAGERPPGALVEVAERGAPGMVTPSTLSVDTAAPA